MPLVECETLPGEVKPVLRNTSAVNKFNEQAYLDAFNLGIEGLHKDLIIDKYKTIRDINRTQWQYYEASITLDSTLQGVGIPNKDTWELSKSIKNDSELNNTRIEGYNDTVKSINHAFGIFQKSIGLKAETEKEKFVSKHFLQDSIRNANRLICELFQNTKFESELYIDPEEPEYKYLNITLKPENVTEDNIDSLLDKFDKLQDRFLEANEQAFSSKITFHIEIV